MGANDLRARDALREDLVSLAQGDIDRHDGRDLAPMWLKGEYFPLLYSRRAVEAATESRVHLVPAK